jgi:hypothetical protein
MVSWYLVRLIEVGFDLRTFDTRFRSIHTVLHDGTLWDDITGLTVSSHVMALAGVAIYCAMLSTRCFFGECRSRIECD